MLLGRQVLTDHGVRIDLLALDEGGTLPHLIDGCLAATGLIIEPW